MVRVHNQKLKPVYLMKILLEQTDEDHCLSLQQILVELERYGITAERKSIYSDFEALRSFGLEVEHRTGKDGGYFIADRMFQLPELKLLVDSVQASSFLTHKKSRELIQKLESLTSSYQAKKLHRQVYVTNRIKTMNESIYYNVDGIHEAINLNRKISFRYYEYHVDKEKSFKRNGAHYLISPYMLIWNDNRYYMIGYDSEEEKIKHYRVDKMTDIDVVSQIRDGRDLFESIDPATYAQKFFSMYGGTEESVRIMFEDSLIGVVLDRFGKDIIIYKNNETHFVVTIKVALSPQFYGWLFSLGGGAKILSPSKAVKEYRTMLSAALDASQL